MVLFENRRAATFFGREHRKRCRVPFAARWTPRSTTKTENPRTGGNGPRVPCAFVTRLDERMKSDRATGGKPVLSVSSETVLGAGRLLPDERKRGVVRKVSHKAWLS